eukprot:2034695-Pyramimonas_sp.AAC.2
MVRYDASAAASSSGTRGGRRGGGRPRSNKKGGLLKYHGLRVRGPDWWLCRALRSTEVRRSAGAMAT